MMKQEIPEELITDILWRLPITGCVVRFLCVCKSWHALLSDPSFIRREKSVDSRLQIMINFTNNDERSVYSLHSVDTLEPLLPSPALLPINPEKPLTDNPSRDYYERAIEVAGSCNGLICISDGDCDLILWNPATSETKLVPPSADRRYWSLVAVGFGFDSEMDDYKIVRQFEYDDGSWGSSHGLEVYSLRNDSWTELDDDDDDGNNPFLDGRQIPQCNKGKLYWWFPDCEGFLLDSFDISSHEFGKVDLPYPYENVSWDVQCLLNEDSMVAVLGPYDDAIPGRVSEPWEVWVLLKYWVPESWIKLASVTSPPSGMTLQNSIGISKDSKCLFLASRHSFTGKDYSDSVFDSDYVNYDGHNASLVAFHPEIGKFSVLDVLEVQGKRSLVITNYMPSQVCMRDYYMFST